MDEMREYIKQIQNVGAQEVMTMKKPAESRGKSRSVRGRDLRNGVK